MGSGRDWWLPIWPLEYGHQFQGNCTVYSNRKAKGSLVHTHSLPSRPIKDTWEGQLAFPPPLFFFVPQLPTSASWVWAHARMNTLTCVSICGWVSQQGETIWFSLSQVKIVHVKNWFANWGPRVLMWFIPPPPPFLQCLCASCFLPVPLHIVPNYIGEGHFPHQFDMKLHVCPELLGITKSCL